MKRDKGLKIAYGGLMTAISTLAVILSHYITFLTVSFSIVAAIALIVLLSLNFLRESIISFVATSVISSIIISPIYALPYMFVFGGYTLISYILNKYIKNKPLNYIIKIVYGVIVFNLLIQVFKLFITAPIIEKSLENTNLYIILNVAAVAVCLAYDYALIRLYPLIDKVFLSKLNIGKKHNNSSDSNNSNKDNSSNENNNNFSNNNNFNNNKENNYNNMLENIEKELTSSKNENSKNSNNNSDNSDNSNNDNFNN